MLAPSVKGGIRVFARPDCMMCDRSGGVLYTGLRDRLYGTPGDWTLKQCPVCGLVWLDPMPRIEDIAKAYGSYYTHRGAEAPFAPPSFFRRVWRYAKDGYLSLKYGYERSILQRAIGLLVYLDMDRRAGIDYQVMYLQAICGGRLLEVGFGGGETLMEMSRLGWEVQGVDPDPVAVEAARARSLNVRCGSLEEQKYPDASFDAIVMGHVIEHVHDPERLLRECRRILRPGGQLSIVTPNAASWGHQRHHSDWLHLDPPRHLHVFSVWTLRKLVEEAGFLGVRARTTLRDAPRLFTACRSLRMWGQFSMTRPLTPAEKLRGRCLQLIEWTMLKFQPSSGEEVALIAVNP